MKTPNLVRSTTKTARDHGSKLNVDEGGSSTDVIPDGGQNLE